MSVAEVTDLAAAGHVPRREGDGRVPDGCALTALSQTGEPSSDSGGLAGQPTEPDLHSGPRWTHQTSGTGLRI
jgi:hypothetical protein